MSTQSQVDNLERKLNELSRRYNAQGKSARNLIDADQSDLLSCLDDGVQAIRETIKSFKTVQDITIDSELQLSISLDLVYIDTPKVPGAFVTERDLPETDLAPYSENTVALRERCTEISTCFTRLAESADKQLEDIKEIQLAAMDVEAELDRFKSELEKTTESAQSAVKDTHESLKSKKIEEEHAQSRLNAVAADLRTLETEAKENKTHRKVAKAIKIGALGLVPVFGPLPAIGVAAVGQIGHMVLKDKKQDLINQKESANTQNRTLQSEIATFEQQTRELESSLEARKQLLSKCGELTQQAQNSKKELGCKANEYQTLKEAASNFLLWTERLQNRAGLMEDFDDGEQLARMAGKLVDDLERCERDDVSEICRPLRALGLDFGGVEGREREREGLLLGLD